MRVHTMSTKITKWIVALGAALAGGIVLPALAGDTVIRMAIVVPERFEEQLLAGKSVTVQTLMDGTFPLYADTTKGYVIAVNRSFTQELLTDFLARMRGLAPTEARRLAAQGGRGPQG